MKRHIYTLALLLLTLTTLAQSKRANVWYFGSNAGLDFNTNPPTVLTDGKINTIESAGSTISDTSGRLLFYTDGIDVWNRFHQRMPNGGYLKGNQSSTQSAIIIPWPGRDSLYYIFTTDQFGDNDGLQWHLVNMNLDNGKGDIVSKNNLIITPVSEKLAATMHGNGRDVWVTVQGYNTNDKDVFYTYLVTNQGFQSCPVISKIGSQPSNPVGQMKFSKDGKLLLNALYKDYRAELFNFDNLTGRVLNLKNTLNTQFDNVYGVEIDGDMVYISNLEYAKNFVTRYDLSYKDDWQIYFKGTQTMSSGNSFPLYAGLQLSPDSNLYQALIDNSTLKYIDTPSVKTYPKIPHYTSLSPKKSKSNFPSFISNYFNSKEPPFYYNLSSDSVYIYTQLNSASKWLLYKDALLIDSSQNTNPKFNLQLNSIYKIKLITNANDTFERFVLKESKLVSFYDTTLCDKDSFLLNTNSNYHCINWQDTINSNSLWIYKNGIYKVTGIDGNNNFITDSVSVNFLKSPKPDLGRDTAFCGNTTLKLKGDSGLNYLWNTGDTTQEIKATAKGLYTLKESNNICYTIDSINIDIYSVPKPLISKLSNNLSVNPAFTNFQWYKNEQPITGAKASQYIASAAGNYFVIVTDSNGCVGSSDTVGLNIGIQSPEREIIDIYPNPVHNILTIDCQNIVRWQLMDITGRILLAGNTQTIDLANLTNATFILNIQTSNFIQTFKIIKQ